MCPHGVTLKYDQQNTLVRTPPKTTAQKLLLRLTLALRLICTLRARLGRRQRRIAGLEAELRQYKCRFSPTPVAGHTYPAEMIGLAVHTVVHGNGSLRCAAKVAGYFSVLMGWKYTTPSHNTVSNWTKRLGLYALDHLSTTRVGKYVGIIDESIQIGREKCLLFLGIRLPDTYSRLRPLTMADVEVLGVEVRQHWTGDEVEDFVRQRLAAHHPGIELQYMISDGGTNLTKALEQLQLDAVADCSHVLMRALKKLLAKHPALMKLTAFMGTFRRQHLLSDRSALCPATLRDKDRFLRIFVILDWVKRIDLYWPQLPPAHRTMLKYLRTKRCRAFLAVLAQLRQVICLASAVLKTSGLNEGSQRAWSRSLAAYRKEVKLCTMAEQLVQVVDNYFADHAGLWALHGGRLHCCSDIIESTFGRYKNKGGMQAISADVLAIPLYARTIDLDFVVRGLTTVSQKHIDQWHQTHTCHNRYSILRQLKSRAKRSMAAA